MATPTDSPARAFSTSTGARSSGGPPTYLGNIFVTRVAPGVLDVNIRTAAYPGAADHWREQLTGANARRWGRLYIDPDAREGRLRRRDACAPLAGVYKGEPAANLDECPGAMFIWETRETASVRPVCARANQDLGRDLYHALARAIGQASELKRRARRAEMGWWEVRFRFDDFPGTR